MEGVTAGTTDVAANSSETADYNAGIDYVGVLCFYSTFLVIVLGVVGNTLSIIVFVKFSLSTGTVGQYLTALALADNIVLLSHLPIWISDKSMGYDFIDTHDWLCRSTFYLKYAGRIWSACLTLTLTVERYLFVAYPLRIAYLQERRIHRIIIPVTMLLSLVSVIYSPFLLRVLDVQGNGTRCFVSQETKYLFFVLDITIVRAIGDILLGILIFVFTILTIRALFIARRVRNNNLEENSSNMLGSDTSRGTTRRNSASRERQITRMLLLLAAMFVLFKVPYTALYYATLNLYRKETSGLSTADEIKRQAKLITQVLGLAGYSFNFFVYVSLVPTFRKKLHSVFRCT